MYFDYRLREDPPLTGGVLPRQSITPRCQPYNCF